MALLWPARKSWPIAANLDQAEHGHQGITARTLPAKRQLCTTDLEPVWQWNHVPVDGKWSLTERPGFLRLYALPAENLWTARNTLTQRAIGPRSIPTVLMDATGIKPGDVAGFALFNRPYAWLGVERNEHGLNLVQFDE
jgi:beta-xylosidase